MVVDTGDMVTGADATTEGVGDTGKVVKWWLPWLEVLWRFLRYMARVAQLTVTGTGARITATRDTIQGTPSEQESLTDSPTMSLPSTDSTRC